MNVRSYVAGPFGQNGYLVVDSQGRTAVAVDPGAGAEQMMEEVVREGLTLEAVLLTHAHLDHVEGIPTLQGLAPVPLYLHPKDRPLYDQAPEQARAFGLPVPDLPAPDHELEHGQTLAFGDLVLDVRHAPGHSPGHVIFHAPDHGVALVGDVVFQGSIGRTDLPGGNFQELMRSIREQVLTLPDETRLLSGHGPETTVGHERRGNPFLVPQYGGEPNRGGMRA